MTKQRKPLKTRRFLCFFEIKKTNKNRRCESSYPSHNKEKALKIKAFFLSSYVLHPFFLFIKNAPPISCPYIVAQSLPFCNSSRVPFFMISGIDKSLLPL